MPDGVPSTPRQQARDPRSGGSRRARIWPAAVFGYVAGGRSSGTAGADAFEACRRWAGRSLLVLLAGCGPQYEARRRIRTRSSCGSLRSRRGSSRSTRASASRCTAASRGCRRPAGGLGRAGGRVQRRGWDRAAAGRPRLRRLRRTPRGSSPAAGRSSSAARSRGHRRRAAAAGRSRERPHRGRCRDHSQDGQRRCGSPRFQRTAVSRRRRAGRRIGAAARRCQIAGTASSAPNLAAMAPRSRCSQSWPAAAR